MNFLTLAAAALSGAPGPGVVLGPTRLFSTLVGLLVVLAAILTLAWCLKRFKLAGASATRSIKILEVLAIGQRERLLVVDWEGQRLLLACGNGSVTQLAQQASSRPLTAVDFASTLQAEASEAACNTH